VIADRRDAHDDRGAALAQHVHRHPSRGAGAVGLEGPLRAAAGEGLHALDRVLGPRVHGVGGAELPREVERGGLDVHRHDGGGPGQARALHGVEADAAAADDHHAVARLHARVEQHRAHAGGDAAADERQRGEVETGGRRYASGLGHHRVVGEARHLAHVGEILAREGVQARGVVEEPAGGAGVLVAQVRPSGLAGVAVPAVGHEAQDHAVARLDQAHALADRLHGAGALVAHHRGHGDARLALLEVQVAPADAGGAHLDEDLTALGRVQLDRLDRVGLVDGVEHGGSDAHDSLPPGSAVGPLA
jgi:hypothetical protein